MGRVNIMSLLMDNLLCADELRAMR